jgi:hypothetical protein
VSSPRIWHYIAGTSTLLNAYTDRAKTTTAAQPLVGDANGVASAYFDGLYKIVVKKSDDATVLFTWDNFSVLEATSTPADDIFRIVGSADSTKQLAAEVDGNTTGVTLTLQTAQTTTRTLNIPNLTATDTLVTTGLPQTITGVKTLTNPTTAAGTTSIPSLTLTGGTNLTSAAAGAVENDSTAIYATTNTTDGRGHVPTRQHLRLTADGSNITTIANYFGTTSNISLVASAAYYLDVFMVFTKTTTEAMTITLTNSAAPTSQNILWEQSPITGLVAPPGTATRLTGYTQNDATAALAIVTGSLTTAVKHFIRLKIELTNGAGTSLKIQASNPAGSITPLRGSYWTATRIPSGNTGTFAA